MRRAWELDGVAATYEDVLGRFRGAKPASGDPILLAHLELIGALRHFPFIDPQLPEALLPGWIGREATKVFERLSATWSPPAHERWRAIVEPPRRA